MDSAWASHGWRRNACHSVRDDSSSRARHPLGGRVARPQFAMPGAGDFYFDSLSQVRMGRWHRRRTVLLGDAGYCGSPLVGLGTAEND